MRRALFATEPVMPKKTVDEIKHALILEALSMMENWFSDSVVTDRSDAGKAERRTYERKYGMSCEVLTLVIRGLVAEYKLGLAAISGVPDPPPPMFSAKEIEDLILLCHPDKHGLGNSQTIATRITQRLLELRSKHRR